MLRRIVVGLLLAVFSSTALAVDPLTLILLRYLRNQIITHAAEAIYDRLTAPQPEPQGPVISFAPRYDDDERLRSLIDEGFVYLSASQREEAFLGVKRVLADPKNADVRFQIVEALRVRAGAVRQAHDALRNLSRDQKRLIAVEAREEYRKLPPEERHEMLTAAQSGVMPIPRDLNEMILAEFRSVER